MPVTNEPTTEQVEASADAAGRVLYPHWDEWEDHEDMAKAHGELMREAARAALVAAQGAAPPVNNIGTSAERVKNRADSLHVEPQAESNPTSSYISPHLPGMIRNLWKSDPSENSVRTALKLAGDLIQELIDLRAAPVLPSSTTPQAEAYDHCCQHPKCPGGSLCCCASEQRLRDCWNQWREEIAGDSKQAFRDGYQAGQNDPAPWLTAPVLPSSTVDENALSGVISLAYSDWQSKVDQWQRTRTDHPGGRSVFVARAVAAWIEEQGR